METELKMTLKEADRLTVMRLLENKKITLKQASKELSLSYRQQIRIWQEYQKKGPPGLISRKRGQTSNNRLSDDLIQTALHLIREKYWDYGPTLVKEKLEEKHSLKLAKETIRQIMIKDSLWEAKRTKDKKIHPR